MRKDNNDIFSISVTELLLIIMFALLIVMILLNATTQSKLDEHKYVVDQYEEMTKTLKGVSDLLGLSSESNDPASIELTEAVAQMQALIKVLKASVESDEAAEVLAKMKLNEVWSSLSKLNNETNIPELLAAIKQTSEALEKCLRELEDAKAQLVNNEEKKKSIEQENERLKSQIIKQEKSYNELKKVNSNLIGQVENLSNGLEYPPCWATADGKPQYTYLVAVHDSSLVVTSIYPKERKSLYKVIITNDYENTKLGLADFKSHFRVFYNDAITQVPECRYFVKIQDKTSARAKNEYKLGLQTIESIFYKYLMN